MNNIRSCFAILVLGASACTPTVSIDEDCLPLTLDGYGNAITVIEETPVEFTAKSQQCGDQVVEEDSEEEVSVQYEWFYDQDADGKLSISELEEPVQIGQVWTYAGCQSERGIHAARVVASAGADRVLYDFTIEVAANPETRTKPACYEKSISSIKGLREVQEASDVGVFDDAIDCLDPYLVANQCDIDANVASGFAHIGAFISRLQGRVEARNELEEQFIETLLEEEIEPTLRRYRVITSKAPDNYEFSISGKFELLVFKALPFINGDTDVRLLLQGEHDMADFHFAESVVLATKAFVELGLSYHGIVEFILALPRFDKLEFATLRKRFIGLLVSDDEFLNLKGDIEHPNFATGRERLQAARQDYIAAINSIRETLALVSVEKDDQANDIVRYWDCGSDGICDCSGKEVFLVCPNEADEYTGPDDDDTEGNGRYDLGEPVGLERLSLADFVAITLPGSIEDARRQLELIRVNIEGPKALDWGGFTQVPVEIGLDITGVPYPSVRLSQWFDSPSNPRDLVPMYNKSTEEFAFELEGEPYTDVGYDGVSNRQETIKHANNPRGLAVGTPYNLINNPDPHFDDIDVICNPVCNFVDEIDNDADGLTDFDDRAYIDQLGIAIYIPQELGIENNLQFDFVDINNNRLHEATEPAEPFSDEGVINHKGARIGANNDHYDFADRSHAYPSGPQIGPVSDLDIVDPANGTSDDIFNRAQFLSGDNVANFINYEGLFDPFYLFFVDPTFSGVLTFEEEVIGIGGEKLTENAKLMRFASKILELASIFEFADRTGNDEDIGAINLGGHRCINETLCRDAVDIVK